MALPNINLTALSENATRLGMRLQESISERTRELGLQGFAGRGVSLGSLELTEEKNGTIKKQLESNSDREKLDAMRKLVALIPKYATSSPHPHFASVVKLVSSPNIEIRKLVYIYLLQYSAYHPDLTLLAVNGLKREMAGELVGVGAGGVGGYAAAVAMRGWAVRVLCGMALGVAGLRGRAIGTVSAGEGGGGLTPLARLAVAKCVKDGNVYVRKVGALSLIKCYELDPAHPSNLSTLSTLLSDPSPLVIGSVLYTFTQISPTRYDLLHKHFRRICKLLVEMDDWGQVFCLGVLARYGRVMLPRPSWRERNGGEGSDNEEEVDKDLKLLLDSVKPVLQSRNPAVVVAATHVLYYLGPPSYWPHFVPHLLRLFTVSPEVERIVLTDLLIISKKRPDLLAPHLMRFLARCDDLSEVKKDKIRIMLNIVNGENWAAILREFIDYAEDIDNSAVEEAISAIGSIAMRISQAECMSQCLTALIMMIKSRYDVVVSNAVMVLKRLVQVRLATPQVGIGVGHSPLEIVAHLSRRIDDIKHPKARACVVWLVGQYASVEVGSETGRDVQSVGGIIPSAPDVLRKLAKSFTDESSLVKLQVVTLTGKLVVLCREGDREGGDNGDKSVREKIGILARYVFSLARYDKDWDVRDRGRMIGALVGGFIAGGGEGKGEGDSKERVGVVLRREQVKVVLFDGKQVGKDFGNPLDEEGVGMVGSFGRAKRAGGGMSYFGEESLPDWLERGVASVLRDAEEVDGIGRVSGMSGFGSRGVGVGGQELSLGQGQEKVVLIPTGESAGVSGTSTPAGSLKGPWTGLDAFYNEEDEKDEEEDEEDEDDEDEGEEDEDEEDEEENEGEDEGEEEDEAQRESEEIGGHGDIQEIFE